MGFKPVENWPKLVLDKKASPSACGSLGEVSLHSGFSVRCIEGRLCSKSKQNIFQGQAFCSSSSRLGQKESHTRSFAPEYLHKMSYLQDGNSQGHNEHVGCRFLDDQHRLKRCLLAHTNVAVSLEIPRVSGGGGEVLLHGHAVWPQHRPQDFYQTVKRGSFCPATERDKLCSLSGRLVDMGSGQSLCRKGHRNSNFLPEVLRLDNKSKEVQNKTCSSFRLPRPQMGPEAWSHLDTFKSSSNLYRQDYILPKGKTVLETQTRGCSRHDCFCFFCMSGTQVPLEMSNESFTQVVFCEKEGQASRRFSEDQECIVGLPSRHPADGSLAAEVSKACSNGDFRRLPNRLGISSHRRATAWQMEPRLTTC